MKDRVNANIRFSKDKTSKYQSSKLINDDTMEKSAQITEKMNIHLNDVRKKSRSFYESKKKKLEKVFPLKPNTQPLKMLDQVQSDNGLPSVTQC